MIFVPQIMDVGFTSNHTSVSGYDSLPISVMQAITTNVPPVLFIIFQEHFGITDSIEKIQSDWNDMAIDFYRHRIGMKKGARELLTQMKERGMKIGIATSNSVELTEECLAANGVADLFDTVRTSRDTPRGKPFPDIYLSVADEWGIAPEDLIVFEDIPNGAIAGKRAGMEVIAVADDYALPRREELIRIADFTQIL